MWMYKGLQDPLPSGSVVVHPQLSDNGLESMVDWYEQLNSSIMDGVLPHLASPHTEFPCHSEPIATSIL
jgi:hypothetical protein